MQPVAAPSRAGESPMLDRRVRVLDGIRDIRAGLADRLKDATPAHWRRRLVRARLSTRLATAPYRALPSFLIIGGERCGTSSLYRYLGRHPQIVPFPSKRNRVFQPVFRPRGILVSRAFSAEGSIGRCTRSWNTVATFRGKSPVHLRSPRARAGCHGAASCETGSYVKKPCRPGVIWLATYGSAGL